MGMKSRKGRDGPGCIASAMEDFMRSKAVLR